MRKPPVPAADPKAEPECPEVADGPGDLPILTDDAALVYEILCELPAHRGLTGSQILDELRKHGRYPDLGNLRTRVIAQLEPYGLEKKARVGYRIPQSKRPKK